MSQGRDLTPVEYLCLLFVALEDGANEPLTLAKLGNLMHPHPSPEAADNVGWKGFARMATSPRSGANVAGTLVTTEEGRRALVQQRNSVVQELTEAIELHKTKAAKLRSGDNPLEGSAKDEDGRAGKKVTLVRKIRRLQADVFAKMNITSEMRAMIDSDQQEADPGVPLTTTTPAELLAEAVQAMASEGVPAKRGRGRPRKADADAAKVAPTPRR